MAKKRGAPCEPATATTRVLALEVTLGDGKGRALYSETRRFYKHFALVPLVGGVPFMLIANTQLQAGEKRRLHFALPPDVSRQARRLSLVLRMYDVADKYEGDIAMAHWRSAPILRKTVRLATRC